MFCFSCLLKRKERIYQSFLSLLVNCFQFLFPYFHKRVQLCSIFSPEFKVNVFRNTPNQLYTYMFSTEHLVTLVPFFCYNLFVLFDKVQNLVDLHFDLRWKGMIFNWKYKDFFSLSRVITYLTTIKFWLQSILHNVHFSASLRH